jgi:hypothetical protein
MYKFHCNVFLKYDSLPCIIVITFSRSRYTHVIAHDAFCFRFSFSLEWTLRSPVEESGLAWIKINCFEIMHVRIFIPPKYLSP